MVSSFFTEPFYYQQIPTFRVQTPGNKAVGEFHTDAQYGHPAGEVNFWVPLTYTKPSSTILLASPTGLRPMDADPGDMVVFDAVSRRHGNLINAEKHSRVSFDFRCLPVSRYRPSDAVSVNTGTKFAPGHYYALHSELGRG